MTILTTPRLLLRPFTEGDAAELYEYAKDPQGGAHRRVAAPHERGGQPGDHPDGIFGPQHVRGGGPGTGRVIGSAGFTGKARDGVPQPERRAGLCPEPGVLGAGPYARGGQGSELLRYAFDGAGAGDHCVQPLRRTTPGPAGH